MKFKFYKSFYLLFIYWFASNYNVIIFPRYFPDQIHLPNSRPIQRYSTPTQSKPLLLRQFSNLHFLSEDGSQSSGEFYGKYAGTETFKMVRILVYYLNIYISMHGTDRIECDSSKLNLSQYILKFRKHLVFFIDLTKSPHCFWSKLLHQQATKTL